MTLIRSESSSSDQRKLASRISCTGLGRVGFYMLLLTLLGLPYTVSAAPYWANVIYENEWPTSYAACYQGDALALLEQKKTQQPQSQWRIGTFFIQEYWPDVEAQCRHVIEKKVGFVWVTDTLTDKTIFRTGEDDICEAPESALGICYPKGEDCTTAGNPIVIASGAKRQLETDYQGAGTARPLLWQRTYNHQHLRSVGLGMGWRHSYSHRITLGADANSAFLYRADGRVFSFTLSGGNWVGDPDVNGTLSRAADNTWSYRNEKDELEHYSALGQLLTITDLAGQTTSLGYDSARRLLSVTDPAGRQLTLSYDANDRIQTLTDPEGNVFTYGYDANDNLITVTFTPVTWPGSGIQTVRTYQYQDPNYLHALTGIIDENGGATPYASFSYDTLGRAASSSHAGGADLYTLLFNPDGTVAVTDPLTTQRTYTFSTIQGVPKLTNLTQPCEACGQHWASTTYDANGNRDLRTDFNGHITDADFDLARNLETQRIEAKNTPEQRTLQTDWHASYRLPTEIREYDTNNVLVKRTTLTYTTSGQLESRTEEDPNTLETRTWTYSYYTSGVLQGLLQSVDGPRTDVTDVTSYEYYTSNDPGGNYRIGDLWKTTNALGQVTEVLHYDAHGRARQIQDPNGVITQLDYHPRGWLLSRTEAFGTVDAATTTFTYDNVGQLDIVTQPNGAWLDYDYDAAHRLTDITDNLGNTIHYTLDAAGNRTGEDTFDPQNTLKRSLNRVYDSLGRLQDLIGNNGQQTRFTYDGNGNLTNRTDGYGTALARTTTQDYDALDRLIRIIDPYNGASKPTDYSYNSLNQLIQVTDPEGLSTSYGFNALGNQHTLQSPDTGTTTTLFDAAGNRSQQTDARGVVAGYDYDALGRITLIDYADNSLDVSYSYDDTTNGNFGLGRLTSMSDASGTASYVYDRRGRLIQQTRTILGIPYQTDYAYDAAGHLSQITYPSGRTVDYTLDSAGRVSAVSTTYNSGTETLASNIQYDPFGPMTDFSYGNGLNRSVSFDLDGRIDTLQSSPVQDLDYGYNALDQLTGLNDLIDPSRDQTLGYDTLDRLDSASGGYGSLGYSYDGVGNRQSQTSTSGTDNYNYDPQSHRLLGVTGPNVSSRGYDNAGNTTQLDGWTLAYGDHNRLQEITQGTTPLASYTHNGQGQRVIKTANGATTIFHYDQAGQLLAETDASGQVSREYIHLNGQPLALITANSPPPTVTVYEDAEDGTTAGWQISDADPAGASITNIPAKGWSNGRVILLSGSGIQNSFRLRNADNTWWNNTEATQARWSFNITPPPIIPGALPTSPYHFYFDIETDQGLAFLHYQSGTGIPYIATSSSGRPFYRYYFDPAVIGVGQWHTITRDLEADLQNLDPARSLVAVRAFVVRGSGQFDNIELLTPATAPVLTTYYLHPDHLGTVRAITDTSQTVVWRWDSAPFGATLPDEDPDGDGQSLTFNLRFPGQFFDTETGLHYNYFRDYDPSIGRYVQSDPIGLGGGINTYAYVEGNPINKKDPEGLDDGDYDTFPIDPEDLYPPDPCCQPPLPSTPPTPPPICCDDIGLTICISTVNTRVARDCSLCIRGIVSACARCLQATVEIEVCRQQYCGPEYCDNVACL